MATPLMANEARFTLAEVAEITGGELVGDPALRVEGVFTDSRVEQPHGLFVALVGERFDGHDYVDSVTARAVLVEESTSRPHVRVESTLVALGALAQAHRLRWGGTLVAITGSVGKTTTRAFVSEALRSQGLSVCATSGNLNNFVGLPMSLLTLKDEQVGVFEAGTSAQGEIEALGAMALPDVAIITAVRRTHTEGIGSLEDIGVEKRSLLHTLEAGDAAVLPSDDPLLDDAQVLALGEEEQPLGEAGFERVRFGNGEGAVRLAANQIARDDEGTLVREVRLEGERSLVCNLKSLGLGAGRAAAAALSTLLTGPIRQHVAQIDLEALRLAFEGIEATPGRMHVFEGTHVVIDDSYNASPASVNAALDDGARIARLMERPLVTVLGEMGELGEFAAEAHQTIGDKARALAQRAVFVGKAFGPDALGRAADVVLELDEPSVVLVKGSRSVGLERVAESLRGAGA